MLRYRRLISMYAPSPYDVLDRYLDAYGADALFPIADTDIGRLAAIASEEILYPEIARCHAMKKNKKKKTHEGRGGVHPPDQRSGKPAAHPRRISPSRLAPSKNLAYVVSANTGGMTGTPIPQNSADRGSKIVDPRGSSSRKRRAGPPCAPMARSISRWCAGRAAGRACRTCSRATPAALYAGEYARAVIHPGEHAGQ